MALAECSPPQLRNAEVAVLADHLLEAMEGGIARTQAKLEFLHDTL